MEITQPLRRGQRRLLLSFIYHKSIWSTHDFSLLTLIHLRERTALRFFFITAIVHETLDILRHDAIIVRDDLAEKRKLFHELFKHFTALFRMSHPDIVSEDLLDPRDIARIIDIFDLHQITVDPQIQVMAAATLRPVRPRMTTQPPVIYSSAWSPQPSTTAVAPELRTAKRSPAWPHT